ncbi:MAG: phenylalanine--tRNA ligase subunit alpha, partial [Salinibacterium sp.]|nr:phenylalanine--tRNA ligase subunit alpha [Salinibacterium sp.]
MSDSTPTSNPSITVAGVGSAADAAAAAITAATTVSELRLARAAHAGEASPLALLNGSLKSVPAEDRAAAGKLVGQARATVATALAEREAQLAAAEESERLTSETLDVTAVPMRWQAGARHPLSLLMEHMSDIFVGMGWEVAEGPELENEWFNFDALNFDEDHPARAMQDTFFVDPV